ncbi:MAG: hypothetical protein KDD25_04770 [Bdellovibrionales bacterium]|nr:hypothetical protein [Bdellovibrionales bacterium]
MPILLTAILVLLAGCTSPHKAEDIQTKMDSESGKVSGETVGVKSGEMVVQRKTLLAEELRRLQYYVYELEDRVYGNRKYGSKGLHGVLKQCRLKLSEKALGGDGKLKWTEPVDRVTDKEPELKIGLDENNNLVAISEEYIKDRLERFRKYKTILQQREDDLEEKVDICETELKSRMTN